MLSLIVLYSTQEYHPYNRSLFAEKILQVVLAGNNRKGFRHIDLQDKRYPLFGAQYIQGAKILRRVNDLIPCRLKKRKQISAFLSISSRFLSLFGTEVPFASS